MAKCKIALELVKLAMRANPGAYQTPERICELYSKCYQAVLACDPE